MTVVNNPTGGARWTPEMDALLRNHYGRLTGGQIVTKLHDVIGVCLTRNAVIGRAKRLGLCKSAEEANRLRRTAPERVRVPSVSELKREAARIAREAKAAAKAQRDAAKAAAQVQQPEPAKVPYLSLVVAEPVRFVDLPARGCRWPIDMGMSETAQESLFCGAEAYAEGGAHHPYCTHHTKDALQPRKPGDKPRTANELIRSCRRFA